MVPERVTSFAVHHRFNTDMFAHVNSMPVRQKRLLYMCMRKPDGLETTDDVTAESFFPKMGISACDFSVFDVLGENTKRCETKRAQAGTPAAVPSTDESMTATGRSLARPRSPPAVSKRARIRVSRRRHASTSPLGSSSYTSSCSTRSASVSSSGSSGSSASSSSSSSSSSSCQRLGRGRQTRRRPCKGARRSSSSCSSSQGSTSSSVVSTTGSTETTSTGSTRTTSTDGASLVGEARVTPAVRGALSTGRPK